MQAPGSASTWKGNRWGREAPGWCQAVVGAAGGGRLGFWGGPTLPGGAALGAGSCPLTAGLPRRYAEVVVASENSVHKLLELLPGKILNGDKVEVRLATRQNLSQFEAQARKREWGAGAPRVGGGAPPAGPRRAVRPSPRGGGTLPAASGGDVLLLPSPLSS